ncbi:MAG: TerC family protein [Deltaproteobacteria bacterium]|nr:TerC family protein [Deltaproteobacteria bacterium]
MFDTAHLELWAAFAGIVVFLLVLDLAVFNRRAHAISIREAAVWSAIWVGISLLFNAGVWWLLGDAPALEFLTGYVVEKSLSVDNLFVFLVVFRFFGVDPKYQHRVLYWGVLGAIILRTIMIFAGAVLVARFHWVLYVFGVILVISGIKLLFRRDGDANPGDNVAVRLCRKLFPMTEEFHGQRFFIREEGRWLATPMLLVLVTVEFTDVLFAVDSIPAVFGITQDAFIILTSNIFAIMGLRALYFLLAGIMDRFHFLQTGLAAVLTFIGVKMLIARWLHIPTAMSLGIVALILALSILLSLAIPKNHDS